MSDQVRPGRRESFEEIADGVFAYLQSDGGWCLSNAGLVTGGGERAVLIDTAATEARARRLRAHVEQAVPGGPDVLVNTHHHGDHTYGNAQFAPRARVVAHARTREDIAEAGLEVQALWPAVEWGETPVVLPDVTFTDTLTLRTGPRGSGPRVELLHPGPAHTCGDAVAWVPERGVLFTGDIAWNGVTPFLLMGSVSGMLSTLDRLRALGATTVVPGHGPPGGPEVLERTGDYVRWLAATAAEGLRAGHTALEAARRARLGRFGELLDSERLVANLHRAYVELEGGEPGARVDLAASFAEMAEYHGGVPACHA
jgi:cyclase